MNMLTCKKNSMKKLILITAIIGILNVGCQKSSDDSVLATIADAPEYSMNATVDSHSDIEFAVERKVAGSPYGIQKLARSAYIGMEVVDFDVSLLRIDSLVRAHKGWIVNDNLYNYDLRISNDLMIRIPSEHLDGFISSLLEIAKKVEYRRIETLDVTEEYIDVESRLKNQRAVEQKFISLLRRTDSINDILTIESKLAEIRSQIESTESRLKYLNSWVNFSIVNIMVYQKVDFKYLSAPEDSFWERFKRSIDLGWKGLVSFVLFLFKIWPVFIGGSIFFLAIRWFLYRSKKKNVKEKRRKKGKDRFRKAEKPNKFETTNPTGE